MIDFAHLTGLIYEAPDRETNDNPGSVLSSVMSKNEERLGAEKHLLEGEEKTTFRRKKREGKKKGGHFKSL